MESRGRGIAEFNIPACAWRAWGKLRKTSVRLAGPRDKIWARDLQSAELFGASSIS
jgi:hypothetical protein